jgi:hypothetical protein
MNYFERKRLEINLMRSWVDEAPLAQIDGQFNVLEEKIRLMRLRLAHQCSHYPVMLTNIKQEMITVLGGEFVTNYSRQGGQFTSREQLPIFYPDITDDLHAVGGTGHFVKSGQSANFIALLFLQSLAEDIKFEVPIGVIYFETYSIMHYLQSNTGRPLSRCKGLFIDSGVMDLSGIDLALIEAHDLIIFDTTCFSSSDAEFLRILRALQESQRTVFLTRSHLKLDSLGVEYGALGSIFVMNPQSFPLPLPSEVGSTDVQAERLIMKLASIAGVHAQPHEVYPFLNEPTFLDLNRTRVATLKTNMGRVVKALENAIAHYQLPLSVERYGHGLYCKVRLTHSFVERLRIFFPKIQNALNYNIFHSDSFGYDFLGICEFSNSQGASFLRVTSFDTDMPDVALDTLFLMVLGLYEKSAP